MEQEVKILNILANERWEEYKKLKLEAVTKESLAFSPGIKEYESWDDEKWKEALKTQQETQNRLVFAEVKGELVGMGSIYYYQMPQFKHNASLQALYVREEWRGKGIGTKLIEERIRTISQNPEIKNVLAEIFSSQQASIELHKKLGFEVVGVINNFLYHEGVYYDSCHLEKTI